MDRLGGVEVADQELLDERGRVRDHAPMGIEDDAVAVEDQLVLAAHGVDPGHERAVVGGAPADHLLARPPLAVVVRRAVDVDQKLRAVVRLPGHRPGGKPAVLTNREADARAVELEDGAAVTGLEIALLVEDAVVGQEDLVEDGLDLAVVEERRRVEDVAVLIDEPDHSRDASGGSRDPLQLREVVAHERGLEDQVFRRVAGKHKLGEADEVGAGPPSPLDPVHDQPGIAGKIADSRVDLRERDPHHFNCRPEVSFPS